MKLTELGFDFSNINTCTIKRRNLMLPLISGILMACFSPIFIVFFILWITGTPFDINGVMAYPGDAVYDQFFNIFLSIFGILSLILFIAFIYGIIQKPRTYIIKNLNADMETYFYIFDHHRKEEIYLSHLKAIIYRKRYLNVMVEENPVTIDKLFDRYIFWHEFEKYENYKIINRNRKTILRHTDKTGRWSLKKSYTFSDVARIVPHKITEIVSTSVAGNNNIKAYHTLYFEDVNRSPYFEMNPEIKKALSQTF